MAASTSTTVLVPATSYDLTDLATVKDELSIPTLDVTRDPFLTRAIKQMSSAVSHYCNRVFPVETVRDVFDEEQAFHVRYGFALGGNERLQLSRHPVVGTPFARLISAGTESGNVLVLTDATGIAVGQPVSHASVPDATTVAAIDGASVTLSIPLSAPIGAGESVGFGLVLSVFNSYGNPLSREIVQPSDYQINAEVGWITFQGIQRARMFVGGRLSQIAVTYQGGFIDLPDDLQDATIRAVTARFKGRGRDPALREQNQPILGQQTYWVGSAPGVRGSFGGEIADILDYYANR
jgi:hypothetical protein